MKIKSDNIVAALYTVAAILILSTVWLAFQRFVNNDSPSNDATDVPKVAEKPMDAVAQAVLNYAANPDFAPSNIFGQLTGTKAEMEMFFVDTGKVYISLPITEDWKAAREKLTKRPDATDFSQSTKQPYKLDKYVLNKPDIYFFRIDATDFKVDPDAKVVIPFPRATYDPTASELSGFIRDKEIMGGKDFFVAGHRGEKTVYSSNFGAQVAVPGEPSLTRLAIKLVGEEKRPERMAQKLLDFVTVEIEYDHDEQEWSDYKQVIKRADEVLMTRKATCASKAALYASLLEQVGIDYVLVYYPSHLAVFVKGRFRDDNGHSLLLDGQRYYYAESTTPGFVIGVTEITFPGFSIDSDWTHVQRPKDRDIPQPRK